MNRTVYALLLAPLLAPLLAALAGVQTPAPEPAPALDRSAHIKVQCETVDANFAAGAKWKLVGRPVSDPPSSASSSDQGEASKWQDREGVLDAEGRVEISFVPPAGFTFGLVVETEVGARKAWSWDGIPAGKTIDLGLCTMSGVGKIVGRILRPNGAPVPTPGKASGMLWEVRAQLLASSGHRTELAKCYADPFTGHFELTDVPVGDVLVSAHGSRYGFTEDLKVDVLTDIVTARDIIVHDIVEAERRIRVTPETPHTMHRVEVRAEHLTLVGPNGEQLFARQRSGRNRDFVFDDVPDGISQILVDHPDVTLRVPAVGMPYGTVPLDLMGTAGIALTVMGEDGVAATGVQVELEMITVAGRTHRPFSPHEGRALPANGVVNGIVPGDYHLILTKADVKVSCELLGLKSGELRKVHADLAESAHMTGRAFHSNGSPAAGITVRLVMPALRLDSPDTRILGSSTSTSDPGGSRWEKATTETDAEGRFSFALPEPGSYLIATGAEARPHACTEVFEAGLGELVEGIQLSIPGGGWVLGTIDVPKGYSLARWTVAAQRPKRGLRREQRCAIDAEGGFELGPLPAGEVTLFLYEPNGLNPSRMFVDRLGRVVPLGKVNVAEGKTTEQRFAFPGPTPAVVSIELSVPMDAAVWHRVELVPMDKKGHRGAHYATSGMGTKLKAIHAAPGTYAVLVCGLEWGWRDRHTVALVEGERTTLALDVELYSRRVRITRAGKPVPGAQLWVESEPGGCVVQGPGRADEDGWINVTNGAGQYTFRLIDRHEHPLAVEWPLEEGVEEIAFP